MFKTYPIEARVLAPVLAAASLIAACGTASAASAVQKECAAKYQAAKAANTLNGQTYRQYYKQCSAEAKAETGAAPAAPASTPVPTSSPNAAPAAPKVAAPASPAASAAPTTIAAAPASPVAPTRRAAAPSAPVAAGNAVFPTAVSAEFAKETPGKARFHTCLAQYHANKANNGNGGLVWLAKGGYYSQCNTRLKG